MTLREAVAATTHLGIGAFRAGIQALSAADRARIECAYTSRLSGSVAIDAVLGSVYGHAHRWDYAIGYRRGAEVVYWVEVHPGSLGDVGAVRAKFHWLRSWLSGEGHRLREFEAQFIWISSGKTTFTQRSPAIRKLAQEGVRAVGRVLRIN